MCSVVGRLHSRLDYCVCVYACVHAVIIIAIPTAHLLPPSRAFSRRRACCATPLPSQTIALLDRSHEKPRRGVCFPVGGVDGKCTGRQAARVGAVGSCPLVCVVGLVFCLLLIRGLPCVAPPDTLLSAPPLNVSCVSRACGISALNNGTASA